MYFPTTREIPPQSGRDTLRDRLPLCPENQSFPKGHIPSPEKCICRRLGSLVYVRSSPETRQGLLSVPTSRNQSRQGHIFPHLPRPCRKFPRQPHRLSHILHIHESFFLRNRTPTESKNRLNYGWLSMSSISVPQPKARIWRELLKNTLCSPKPNGPEPHYN